MAYIHIKNVGDKKYYTLRVSARDDNGRVITKDIENLGNDINKIKIEDLEKKYKNDIRKSYRSIKNFLESNQYIEKIKKTKIKSSIFFKNSQLYEIEAAKFHFSQRFEKLDKLTKKEIYEFFLIKFAVSSTAIEGNTITLNEADRLLKENILPKNKTLREVYDLQNTKKVFFDLLEKKPEINLEEIEKIHDNLLHNIDERKGYRNHDIRILGQPFQPSPAIYVKTDMKLLIGWYNKNKNIIHPLAISIFFHHKFEQIHPFSDGNGRTGRILLNLMLLKEKYPPINIPMSLRKEYLDAINEADKAIKTEMLSTKMQHYQRMFDFMIEQYRKTYWNTFLV